MPSDDTANINFRGALRRTTSNTKIMSVRREDGSGGNPNEITPLISNGNGGNNTTISRIQHHHDGFNFRQFFFDGRRTPGLKSPKKHVRIAAHVWHVTKVSLLSNYVNIFLVMVPLGIVAGHFEWDPTAIFVLNFFAIIPLAAVLSFATEEISERLGETLGGLLNATFGNAVELIVSIIALRDGQIQVVQSSMLGSILSNLLLVMGMCFLFGGIANMRDSNGVPSEQSFASATAQTTCSLMALASASMIIPSTLAAVLDKNDADPEARRATILLLSRGTAVILLLLYLLYLFFQLRTHTNLFVDAERQSAADEADEADEDDGVEPSEPIIGPVAAMVVLVVTTVLVSVCADYLVDSIDPLVETAHISKNFIGLILIPIVGNAAEHVTAVVVAVRNKMDLAMGVAIGSSIQIALLVTPFLVILGWLALDQPMTLQFETFETVAFALSVLLVTYVVQDGKSNYLEGAMLLGLYIIIALAFWASPTGSLDSAIPWFKSG